MSKPFFSLVGKIALEGMQKVNADIRTSEKSVKDFQRELGKLGAKVSQVGATLTTGLTAPIAAVTAAVGIMAVKTGEYADKLLTLNQQTGLTTDYLQEMAHVAKVAGGNADGLFNAVTKLYGQLDSVAKGSGATAEAFEKLDVSVLKADGSYRDMEEIFPEILEGLRGIENETERNTLAYDIFGGKSKEITALLGMTADETDKVRREAHELGLVMSNDALQAANDFRISVDTLTAQFESVTREVAMGFIPILQESFIPLIQNTIIPMVKIFVDILGGLLGVFGSLPAPIQTATIALTAFIALLGPALLATGKLIIGLKAGTGAFAAIKVGALAAAGGVKVFIGAVAVAALPITAVVAAIASLGAAIYVLVRDLNTLKRLKKEAAEDEAFTKQTQELSKTASEAKKLRLEYEKLAGTDAFDPAEMERLTRAHEDAVIAIKAHNRERQGMARMSAEEIEKTRANVQAQGTYVKAVTTGQKQMTDEERKQAEERKRIAADEYRKKKEELASLISKHRDAYEVMGLQEIEIIDREEKAELAKAQKLGATQAQMDVIRQHYSAQRQKLLDEEEAAYEEKLDAEIKALQDQLADAEKAREDANKEWDNKLLQQSGDRLKILDAEYADALAKAHEYGVDESKVHAYYAQEIYKVKKELADKQIEEDKRVADENQKALDKMAQAYQRTMATIGNFVVSTVNQIGSLFSQASRNEEQRLSKEYKTRREYIEANVEDEEERAAQLQALQEEEEAKKLAIQQEQTKRDKAIGIFNTVIDTARGVVRALADPGGIAGAVMAGVIGALGVAQTAVIASTPEPFYAGGMVKGSTDGIVAQVGEQNQDELIMPLDKGVGMLAERLDALQSGNANTNSNTVNVNIHAGVVIGDKHSIKQFVRQEIEPILISENKRRGIT